MRNILGLQCSLAWLRTIYYAAFLFDSLWLVRAFHQIIDETAPFIGILAVGMLGFAVGLSIMLFLLPTSYFLLPTSYGHNVGGHARLCRRPLHHALRARPPR